MMFRQRDSARIRADAMKMAIKKAKEGCLPCVKSYLELAQQHGATEEDFRLALDNSSEASEKGMSRRTLLKIALGVMAGFAVGSRELLPGKAEAYSSWYWGTDSNTGSCCGLPQDFYIGRLGYGVLTGDTQYFNTTAASAAGYNSTYAFWGVQGPDTSTSDPYAWGQQQGTTAANEWTNNPNASSIGGNTIFGDIEPGFRGWGSDQSRNQSVFQGFLDGLVQDGSITPGIYVSPGNWEAFFGTGYSSNQTFVLWIAGCQTCVVSCKPCDSGCSDTPAQVQNTLAALAQNSLGGSGVVVWQYWISDCAPCGDFDVAIQDPASGFSPVSGPVYQCTGCGAGAGSCA